MKPDLSFLDDLSQKLSNAMPESVKHLKSDVEKNFKAILQGSLAKLDVVTREEFDNQKALLHKAQQQLHMLEQRLTELEHYKK